MSEHNIFVVDSFTNEAFRGNPAAVCISKDPHSVERMQSIAKEMNLSETAFVVPQPCEGCFSIRYFSPKMEIPLCGHATLASGKVIFETLALKEICFTTTEDLELMIRRHNSMIEMEFPVYELRDVSCPQALQEAIGINSINRCTFNEENNILMLEIDSTEELQNLAPDFPALEASHSSINGVLVTAKSSDDYDFHSRYFWPWSGTHEDPVTGGTHTFLAPYWAKKLKKTKLRSFQSSERSGEMEVELMENNKLLIRGSAVIVLSGTLHL